MIEEIICPFAHGLSTRITDHSKVCNFVSHTVPSVSATTSLKFDFLVVCRSMPGTTAGEKKFASSVFQISSKKSLVYFLVCWEI